MARSVWRDLFARHLPTWPESPQGALAQLWRDPSPAAGCLLIWIAQVLFTVSRALTAKSVAPFEDKLGELLRLEHAQFEELVAELEVAAGLSERVSPIAFEPLVPEGAPPHRKPYSPDYGIRLPDGDLPIETTVLRIAQFERWEGEASRIAEYLQHRLKSEPLFRVLDLELRIDFRFDSIPRKCLREIIRDVTSTTEGERHLSSDRGLGSIRWSVPPVSKPGGQESVTLGQYNVTITEGQLQSALYVSRRPRFEQQDGAADLVVKSLRNTLDYKLRKWGKIEAPYVLGLKFGHHWLNPQGMISAIAERIMPNPKYRRLSGVLRYTPPDFAAGGRPHELFLLTNDAASFPVGAHVWDLFQGKAQFHLR